MILILNNMIFRKKKINKYNKKSPLFIIGFFIFLLLFTSFSFKIEPVYAQMAVVAPATDTLIQTQTTLQQQAAAKADAEKRAAQAKWDAMSRWEKLWAKTKELTIKSGSGILQDSITSTLNKLAYDAANRLATGNKGQGSLFIKENWNKYLSNMEDRAKGEFIEQIGQKNGFVKFDLCEPKLDVKLKIGLGMVEMNRPHEPACTWSKMKNNWKNEYERLAAMNQPDFLKIFQESFDPKGNDLGAALTLQTGMITKAKTTLNEEGLKLEAKGGWLDPTDIAGNLKSVPEWTKNALNMTSNNLYSNIGRFTGNALIDASKIFINQLAISAFNAKMLKLGEKAGPTSSPYDYDKLADFEASPTSGANDSLRQLLEPKFNTRADYDILAELSTCPDPNKAGPTNCVIDEGFRQAIEERKTVGEAISLGYLKDWPFGFRSSGSGAMEPVYNQGYPYRSMLILRKYRIIPVGWELAAEYINSDQEKLGNATLAKMIACFDPSDSYIGYSEDWCRGLVDPNWVLKAPQNFCAKEGYGPEIISDEIVDGSGGSKERSIARNDNYCADEQSCIKERSDGSCEAYGYCVEERRSWNFEAESCEPKYNTCQTFRGSGGKTVSYLENTLDYSGCSLDNAGCKGYAISFTGYASSTNSVDWIGSNSIYFNEKIEACNEDNEGCHEFIRTKSGLGTNLVVDSGFEGDEGEEEFTTVGANKFNNWPLWIFDDAGSQKMIAKIVGDAPDGDGKVLYIKVENGKGGLYSYDDSSTFWSDKSVMPKGFIMEPGTAYTLSADIYLMAGDYIKMAIGNNDTRSEQTTLTDKNVWKRIAVTVNNDSGLAANEFYIYGYGTGVEFYVDNIQFEIGPKATAYKEYGAANVIYEKLAPAYLNCDKAKPPARCNKLASSCRPADVGCELYTSVSDGFSIPAKTTTNDYCPEECDGFDTYIQAETNFASSSAEYFIPKRAETCSADAAGCDEFTNLDEVAKGGEGQEYYTYLRQCIKPDTTCAEFYTWEGSDESGYQLKVFNLQKNGNEPKVTLADSSECSEIIYNLPATNPGYNPDCRQFYNKEGGISYHLYTRTISCSDNCHSYRRTAIDESKENCEAHGGEWDEISCTYMAIPGEGKACGANQSGCREYSGNRGSNMRIILDNDFSGNKQGWTGAAVDIVSESLTRSGQSLKISNSPYMASTTVGVSVQKGRSYVLSFIAKNSGADAKFNSIKLTSGGNKEEFITAASPAAALTSEWKLYKFNLTKLDHNVDTSESLVITANGGFFIDDIRLTEITDRYYLIKDSWKTPAVCNQDINKNPFPLYMLGCSQYKDRARNIHYLHNFSGLCQESAVGCELMIDTNNSTNAATSTSETNPAVITGGDNFAYVVYDAAKKCNKADKGCSRFGSPYKYGEETVYGDIYLKNDPEKYADILCDKEGEGCQAYGNSIFKDPGDMICEWRQIAESGETGWGWYKKKVKRCNGAGKVCLSDKNCDAKKNETCVLEGSDTPCLTSDKKTFGYGGEGQTVYQPETDWAGTCPAAQADCSEYIDPISKPASGVSYEDGAELSLEPSTLYILKGIGTGTNKLNCSASTLYKLGEDNTLAAPVKLINILVASSTIFFNDSSGRNNCTSVGTIELKKAMIEYRLKQEIDKKTCNGLVDFEQGCILLNERAQNGGSGLTKLNFDADLTVNDKTGVPPQSSPSKENNDANTLTKVTPNRICAEWLACRSYIKDKDNNNVCFDIGLCNGFDDNGNCGNFISSAVKKEQIFKAGDDPNTISNLTGYSKFGYEFGKLGNNYYPLGEMEQVGDIISLSNGGFEMAGGNGYPVGWSNTPGGGAWDDSKFKVITDANEAKAALGASSPPEGKNILKMSPGTSIDSEDINFELPKEYVVSAYVNTMSLIGGEVGIRLTTPPAVTPADTVDLLTVGAGNKGYVTKKFSPDTANWKITVFSDATASGLAYFDDIKIKPALEIKQNTYSSQSCRLYPKENSLSCGYIDDSGVTQKGLTGYCLEYDRPPGSTDSCLLWYPVDKVKGEGVEEGAGYKGKFPLYYCTEPTAGTRLRVKVVADDNVTLYISDPSTYIPDDDNSTLEDHRVANGTKNGDLDEQVTDTIYSAGKHAVVLFGYNGAKTGYVAASIEAVNSAYMEKVVTSIDEKYGWRCAIEPTDYEKIRADRKGIFTLEYEYNDELAWVKPSKILDANSIPGADGIWPSDQYLQSTRVFCRTIIDIAPVCKKFVQTVSAAGDNKVYQTRLSGGENNVLVSTFIGVPGYTDSKAQYNSDAPPFGTIVYPNPAANPYEWDTSANEGIQPLSYSQDKTLSRMGQLHNDNDGNANNYEGELKRLFAQSYGGYTLVPEQTCVGGGKCQLSTILDAVYTCGVNSVNYTQECTSPAVCTGVNCSLNEELNQYTCNGALNGNPCCVPESRCTDAGKCENANPQERASCDIRGIDTMANCRPTGEYKCDSSTSNLPSAGVSCCYGGVCSNVCKEGVNAGKACENSNPDCPIMTCSNDNDMTCTSQQDPNCKKEEKCIDGDHDEESCWGDPTHCNGADGTCSKRRCDGGDHNNEVCDDPSNPVNCSEGGGTCPAGRCSGGANPNGLCYGDGDCPSHDGVCTASYYSCGISTTYGACDTPQCVGGPRDSETCALGGNNQGCVDPNYPNDICVKVQRIYGGGNDGKRCCGPDTGSGTCEKKDRTRYVCVKGSNAGEICSESEVALGETAQANAGRYIPDSTYSTWSWKPSGVKGVCGKTIGGETINCTLPVIKNIKVNGVPDAATTETTIIKNGFANLTFNTEVNPNQLPLVRYEIDWKDEGNTVVSGVEMNHRPDETNEKTPHSVYHLYSYWDLKNKHDGGMVAGIECGADGDTGYCTVQPTVKIKDNWDFSKSETFIGMIKVKEK